MAAVASCGENKFKVCFIFFLQSSVLISRTHMLHCRPVLSTSSQQVDRGNALIVVGKARLVKTGVVIKKTCRSKVVACFQTQHSALTEPSAGARQALVCSSAATRVVAYKLLLVHVLRVLASAESEIIFHSFHCCPCIAA